MKTVKELLDIHEGRIPSELCRFVLPFKLSPKQAEDNTSYLGMILEDRQTFEFDESIVNNDGSIIELSEDNWDMTLEELAKDIFWWQLDSDYGVASSGLDDFDVAKNSRNTVARYDRLIKKLKEHGCCPTDIDQPYAYIYI